jgi:hypothetical protein
MTWLPAGTLFPFPRESQLIDGIQDDSSKYSGKTFKSSVVYCSQCPFSQLSSHLSSSYSLFERIPDAKAEDMPAGQLMFSASSIQDNARISFH